MSKICLTLAESSLSSLQDKIETYYQRVDLIEVRLDYLDSPALPRLPAGSGAEMLATCRPVREGGRYRASESDRLELLSRAARSGFQWVDLEYDIENSIALPAETRTVRSIHLFDQFPQDLDAAFQLPAQAGGDVLKLACRVENTQEAVRLLKWMETLRSEASRVIIGMEVWGQLTRLLGGFLGNSWTYVIEEDSDGVAPGQFGLSSATELYRLQQWETAPQLYGVLANPVGHSRSPHLHNSLFRHYGVEGLYLPIQLNDLASWFDYLAVTRLPFRGFSVTIPFKTEVNRYLERSESPVEAVNTLTKEDSGWIGSNTDRIGFLRPLMARVPRLEGKSALVLGNGGVAHSVTDILSTRKVRVTVVGRNRKRLNEFATRHECNTVLFDDLPIEADICVNTTPVGQSPQVDLAPISEDDLHFKWVYDLIYNPEKTRLLRWAEARGIETISGVEMFIEQGAAQFSRWTGVEPDRRLMRSILRNHG